MGIFRRNAGKIALVALIVFFSLPFIYGNEEENEFSPFAVKSGLSYQANPISKLANRIASFYGLPKSNLTTTSERINMDKGENIRGRVSGALGKQNSESKNVSDTKQNQSEQILSKKLNSFETDQTIVVPSKSLYENATTATSVTYNSYNRSSNTPAVEYVQIDGANYKVVQDITGKKYVATAKGHVPYEQVMRNTVSEREFLAAKKRLVNASDAEIVQYVLDQKKAASNAENNTENKANTANTNTAGYAATGSATSMGGAAKVNNSVKTDTGFDDSILSNVYAEIKNLNAKVDKPASSSSSSSSSGNSSSRGSSYSGDTNSGVSGITVDPKEISKFLRDINQPRQVETETEQQDTETDTMMQTTGFEMDKRKMKGQGLNINAESQQAVLNVVTKRGNCSDGNGCQDQEISNLNANRKDYINEAMTTSMNTAIKISAQAADGVKKVQSKANEVTLYK